MEFRMDGLDEAQKRVRRLETNMRALAGTNAVAARELFTPSFMRQHSHVPTFDALIKAGGFQVESSEDFAAIPDQEWEAVIRQHTDFGSWQEMLEKAGEEYAKQELMSGL